MKKTRHDPQSVPRTRAGCAGRRDRPDSLAPANRRRPRLPDAPARVRRRRGARRLPDATPLTPSLPPVPPSPTTPLTPRAVGDDGSPFTLAGLARFTPTIRKNMIGERLYRLIHPSQPELAGKLTGMLLDLDNGDLLVLLESPEDLRTKVGDALAVLQEAATPRPAPAPAREEPPAADADSPPPPPNPRSGRSTTDAETTPSRGRRRRGRRTPRTDGSPATPTTPADSPRTPSTLAETPRNNRRRRRRSSQPET